MDTENNVGAAPNTQGTTIDPLPCPFCGCPFVSVMKTRSMQMRVACGQCLAEMTGGCSRDNMVRQWNRRTTAAQTLHPEQETTNSPAPTGAVNWSADAWFAMHHAADLTDEFKTWWVAFYGCPEGYPDNEDEQHDYWIRCAFALGGWLAARQPVSERKDGEQ